MTEMMSFFSWLFAFSFLPFMMFLSKCDRFCQREPMCVLFCAFIGMLVGFMLMLIFFTLVL